MGRMDQETFPWHGVPDSKADLELNSPRGKQDDGVVDFEIEYVRLWQKTVTQESGTRNPSAGDHTIENH